MKRISFAAVSGLALIAALTMGTVSPAFAAETPGTVIASAEQFAAPQLLANSPRGLAVTGVTGKSVTIFTGTGASRNQPLTKPVSKLGQATFTGLTAGANYAVSVDGSIIGTATPLTYVGTATGLVVRATSTPTSVDLSWTHLATKANGGPKITYLITATPADTALATVTSQVTGMKSTILTGLNADAIYTFTVTPKNSVGAGKATSARMTRSLADITGIPTVTTPVNAPVIAPVTKPAPQVEPETKTIILPAAPAPAPAAAPAGPSTKTIYVCPDGFSDAGSDLCQKTLAYTYSTSPYTYRAEPNYVTVQTGTRTETAPGSSATGCSNGGTLYGDTCYATYPVYETQQQGTKQVKNAGPAGYTDNGSAWQQRNDMPSGYSDNGSAWVQTTAKVAKVVPA